MDNLFKIILNASKNIQDETTIRQLSKKAKVPYTTTLRLINQNKGLFIIRKKANIKLCSLNINEPIVKHYLILAERSKADNYKKRYPIFKVLQSEIPKGKHCILLFGSRVKETHRRKSDIDICIINKDGKKLISFSEFEMLYNVEINPITFTKKEFKVMLKQQENNVGKEILKNHIILYGEEYFWNIAWENGI